MKKPRALWISIVFVLLLVGGTVALFATGTRPVLGLDLEGGVSVILSAPEDTPSDVMDQRTCVVIKFRGELICEMRDYSDAHIYEEFRRRHPELPKFA